MLALHLSAQPSPGSALSDDSLKTSVARHPCPRTFYAIGGTLLAAGFFLTLATDGCPSGDSSGKCVGLGVAGFALGLTGAASLLWGAHLNSTCTDPVPADSARP
jgi:hypothetical protein